MTHPTSRTRIRVVLSTLAGAGLLFALAGTGRALQEKARPVNRLAGETSPYLLQHARNPVDWYPWGPEAFEKAKREGKPIFLSIGYAACHWCHVMERESFEDEGIARQLNESFVSIKVDREQRPDVDEIYMTACQLVSGRGGWPLSAFLTPDGKPFFAGTYFPRDNFAELLRKVDSTWQDMETRKLVLDSADKLAAAIGQIAGEIPTAGTLSPTLVSTAAEAYLEGLDPHHGGFGKAPKFPPSLRLAVMLEAHREKPNPKLLQGVTLTLDRMARGGMYDQVGGGFHRYSVDERWLVPHFEKMLYDNALLPWIYLEAHRVTGRADYLRTARETLDFVLRELQDPAGGFHSTLDADSPALEGDTKEKEEGAFYLWTPAQVAAVLGKEDGALFCRVYDITPAGNFERRSIPNLLAKPVEAWAKELKQDPAALRARLDRLRVKLRAARESRPRPALDDKVLTSWNGLMLRALAAGYDVTGEDRYRQAAERAAEFLLTRMRKSDGTLAHSYRAGKTQPQVFLEDYSFTAAGLLELHRATGERRWLDAAAELSRRMAADFGDGKTGVLYSTPHGHEALLARPASAEDNATPSGQSMAALALARLSRYGRGTGFRAQAERLLSTYATPMKRFPAAMPNMLLALDAHYSPDDAPSGEEGRVKVAVIGLPPAVRPGQTFEATAVLTVSPTWHLGAEGSKGPGVAKPTRIEAAPGPFKLLSATFPPPRELKARFTPQPLRVHAGTVPVRLKLKALPGAETAAALRLRVRYQACNDEVCERPATETVLAPVTR